MFWDVYWIPGKIIKKTTFIRTTLSSGEVKRGYPGLHGWSLLRSSSNFIEGKYHTLSERHVSYSFTFQRYGPCQYEWPDIAETSKNAFSSGSPITSVKTQLIQLGFSTWPKGAWENSDYFLTSLVKLPRAITSEMAGQGCLDSLQTWMDIWIIMGSQFGPLVKVFLGHIVACLITVLSSIVQFSFTERKYAKDYTLPRPLDKYFVMDQTALAGLLGYL